MRVYYFPSLKTENLIQGKLYDCYHFLYKISEIGLNQSLPFGNKIL